LEDVLLRNRLAQIPGIAGSKKLSISRFLPMKHATATSVPRLRSLTGSSVSGSTISA